MERNNSGLININVNHLESQQVILHIISERGFCEAGDGDECKVMKNEGMNIEDLTGFGNL